MNIKVTPELLDNLSAIAEAATPGPWIYTGDVELGYEPKNKDRVTDWENSHPRFVCDLDDGEYHQYADPAEETANGEYIAAANPAIVLSLIAHIRHLERQADWLAKRCPLEGTESWEESATNWRERARQATNEI